MVDLSGGQDGPLEHAFSNSVFIIPGLVVMSLTDNPVHDNLIASNHANMADDLPETEQLEELLKNVDPEVTKNFMDMMNDPEKLEEMKENLMNMLGGGRPQVLGGSGPWLGVAFAVLIFSIILFFGYKLYKSIKDKEVKREEKKKAKQMKKKK